MSGTVIEIRKATFRSIDYLYVVLTTWGSRLGQLPIAPGPGAALESFQGFTALVRVGPEADIYFCGPGSTPGKNCNVRNASGGLAAIMQNVAVGDDFGVGAEPDRLTDVNVAEAEAALSTLEHRLGAPNDRLHPLFVITASDVSLANNKVFDLPSR